MAYDYREAVKDDVLEYINNEINFEDFDTLARFRPLSIPLRGYTHSHAETHRTPGTPPGYINPHQQEKRRRTPTERPTAYTSPNHTNTARTEAPTPNQGGYSRLHFTATRTK